MSGETDWLSRALLVSGLLFIVYSTHQLLMAIYTVFFGPLAKFPGPPLAAASYVPYAFHLADGTLSEWIKELHEQYNSEVVRISPNDLSFICASAWKDICGPRPGHRPFEKDVAVYGKAPNGIDTLLTAKKQDHSRMRRVLDHAFSTKALKEQEPLILASIDKLVRCLHNQVTRPYAGKVDLTNWYRWMSFDVTGDLAFGESFNCLESEANHPWVQMVFGNLQGIVFMNACSRFPLFASVLPYLIPSRITKMMDDHWASTKAKLARRITNGTARQDFLSPILENNTDKGLMHGEIESNASLLIIAGSDSVASSITGSTWFLTKHPEVMEKLKDEINQAFSKEADITIKSVDQLPYLAAVVDEVLRIYPVALAGQASIIPPKGDTVAGYWLPGNTGVSMNQHAVFHSPTNFTDPDTFAPSRWLGDPHFAADKKDAYYPFSLGARNCIGKGLGLAITRLAIAKMIWHFDLELDPDTDENWLDQKSFIVRQKKPLIVRLKPRRRSQGRA